MSTSISCHSNDAIYNRSQHPLRRTALVQTMAALSLSSDAFARKNSATHLRADLLIFWSRAGVLSSAVEC